MDNTKTKLIESGIKLFGEHGYDGVSIRDIVSDSRANLSAVSYHFGGKAELYKAVVEFLAQEVKQRLQELNPHEFVRLDSAAMEIRLRKIILEFNQLFMSANGISRLNIFTRETTITTNDFVHEYLIQMITDVRSFFQPVLSTYYSKRNEDPQKTDFVISLLVSMLRNIQQQQRLPITHNTARKDTVERLINLILYGQL